jgi:hypothetical protein
MSTTPNSLLLECFTRVHSDLPGVVEGLEEDALHWRPDSDANPVAWLVWHLTRVQDDHLAGVAGREQVWTSQGFAERFGLPYDEGDLGYGQSSDQVGAFRASGSDLLDYHAATHRMTEGVLRGFGDWDRVVDDRWDPPVTAAVRLVSVVNDITQHLGQAAYVRGLLERR